MAIKMLPTPEQARTAIQLLEKAVIDDADGARAPWERGKPLEPGEKPIWSPARWTLKYMRLKPTAQAWAWAMETTDQQVVAYAMITDVGSEFVRVTHNGTERRYIYGQLDYPASGMYKDYFPWETKYKKLNIMP